MTPVYLSRFPNYATAPGLEEVDGAALGPEAFDRMFVRRNRPFVARGVALHWPACSRWGPDGLRERFANVPDLFSLSQGLIERPMREYAGKTVGAERDALHERRPRGEEAHALRFLDRVEAGEQLVAYGVAFPSPGMEPMLGEIESLPFAARPHTTDTLFQAPRLFVYRGGYTDWHFHYGDEALTVQVRGHKELLLLPPDRRTFATLWSVFRRRGVWELDADEAARAFGHLRPVRVSVGPGDAVYLPVFWWHAVEPVDDEPGVTIALPFRSPREIQFDLRFAAARWNVRQASARADLRSRVPSMVLGGAWALARHPLNAPHLPGRSS